MNSVEAKALRASGRLPLRFLLDLDRESFLGEAFWLLLGREPDPKSHTFYRRRLREGAMTRLEVLGHLAASVEGRLHGAVVDGLAPRFMLARVLRRFPAGGRLVQWLWGGEEWAARMALRDERITLDLEEAGHGIFDAALPTTVRLDEETRLADSRRPGQVPAWSPDDVLELDWTRETRTWDPTVFGTLCTVSHLSFGMVLAESIRRAHPTCEVLVCVVDAPADCGSLQREAPLGVRILPGCALGFPDFDYLALKSYPSDLCNALKPVLNAWVLRLEGVEKFVYLDSDLCVYSPMTAMIEALDTHDVVVTPHLFEPFEELGSVDLRPTLGEVQVAGVFNAGMHAVRATEDALRFLETWAQMTTAQGSFQLFGQSDQQHLAWSVAIAEKVAVLRDTTYNVAYWNLHDRSVRRRSDGTYTVDGRPLVSFHFSGFDPEAPARLSSWDTRYPPSVLAESLARLQLEYGEDVLAQRETWPSDVSYGFGRFPSGLAIDGEMRNLFKHYEDLFAGGPSAWTAAGERELGRALLSPLPGSGSLMPTICLPAYEGSPDLQRRYPEAHTRPERFWGWWLREGASLWGWTGLFDLHRPRVLDPATTKEVVALLEECGFAPEAPVDPFGSWRTRAIQVLAEEAGTEFERICEPWGGEIYAGSVIGAVRCLVERYPDLRTRFPDPFEADADGLARWLEEVGPGLGFPETVGATYRSCANGGSLGRVASVLLSNEWLSIRFRRALIGEGVHALVRELSSLLKYQQPYDVEDLAMLVWLLEAEPWRGFGLCCELPCNQRLVPSTLGPEGRRAMAEECLEPEDAEKALARFPTDPCDDLADAWPGDVLMEWDTRPRTVIECINRRYARQRTGTAALQRPSSLTTTESLEQVPGVNLFGFFASPAGVGAMSRGLADAMEASSVEVSRNVLGFHSMLPGFDPEDLRGRYRPALDTNVFVTYPHASEHVLARMPLQKVGGRRNIAYLAWEQEDFSPLWRAMLDDYDEVWALSTFAAENVARGIGRDVASVPCVLDAARLPPSRSKRDVGFSSNRWTVLYVFDAGSSTERKNPEAVLAAFEIAFGDREDVELVFKVSGLGAREHRARTGRFIDRVEASPSRVRLIAEAMEYAEVLGLISAADCYCSLHRAEGFGYTCAEAMAYGTPVVATAYSGNLQFMSDDNSWLVDYDLVEVDRAEGPFQRGSVWAEADVEHAARLLRTVHDGGADLVKRNERARQSVLEQLSPVAVGRQVESLLRG